MNLCATPEKEPVTGSGLATTLKNLTCYYDKSKGKWWDKVINYVVTDYNEVLAKYL